jgi:RNA polymerase sigma-70 factor (ECF subfamily)
VQEQVLSAGGKSALTTQDLTDLLVDVRDAQDRAAFARLFEHYAPRVKSYALKLGSDTTMAEEIAQQTLMQVWRKSHLFDESKAQAGTWIFRIARNLRLDLLRREKHFDYDEDGLNQIEDERDDQETCLARMENAERIQVALRTLPADQIEIIHLSFYEGLSHGQIAQELDLPLGTVKSRMRLAFKKIRTALGEALQ